MLCDTQTLAHRAIGSLGSALTRSRPNQGRLTVSQAGLRHSCVHLRTHHYALLSGRLVARADEYCRLGSTVHGLVPLVHARLGPLTWRQCHDAEPERLRAHGLSADPRKIVCDSACTRRRSSGRLRPACTLCPVAFRPLLQGRHPEPGEVKQAETIVLCGPHRMVSFLFGAGRKVVIDLLLMTCRHAGRHETVTENYLDHCPTSEKRRTHEALTNDRGIRLALPPYPRANWR